MATKYLGGVQYGAEGAHGTAVAADTKLYFEYAAPEQDRVHRVPRSDHGRRITRLAKNATVESVFSEGGSLRDTDGLYYQALPLLLNACLDGGNTGSEANAGQGDYLWTIDAPLTGSETLDTFTLEWGDDGQYYETAYCLIPELSITFDATNGEVHATATVDGDMVKQTSQSSVATNPSAEYINGALFRLYVDDTWASAGSTELSDALVSGELVIRGGAHHKKFGSASRLVDSHGQGEIDAELRLTLERTAAVSTEELKYRAADEDTAPSMRCIRLIATGDAIGASGSVSTLRVDMIGTWESWNTMAAEIDGNTQDEVVFRLADDDTAAADVLTVDVITTIAAI